MIKVGGIPIIELEIMHLRDQGVGRIIVTVNYFGAVIKNYLKDGSRVGVKIIYLEENQPLGTAGSFYYLKDVVKSDFIFIFGDLVEGVDFRRLLAFHKSHRALVTLFAHPNSHPGDSDLLVADKDGKITGISFKGSARDHYFANLVNAGISICSPRILDFVKKPPEGTDFEKDIVMQAVNAGMAFAYRSSEYVKDVGTPERLEEVESDLANGVVQSRALANPQRAIFMDRDGTINVYKGLLTKIDDLELIKGIPEAIKLINSSRYLAIVITNQPVVARGEVTFSQLDEIHRKLGTLLGNEGAYLDDLFYCPHHPDSGFPGEVKELKIVCGCRKPKIGLLLKARDKYNIDLSKSWFIGDGEIDIQTGKNAGCRTIYIGEDSSGLIAKPDFICNDLLAAIKLILAEDNPQ